MGETELGGGAHTTDMHTDRQTDTHINTMIRPDLGDRQSKNNIVLTSNHRLYLSNPCFLEEKINTLENMDKRLG